MTIGFMKKTPIEKLVNQHGLIPVRGRYYILKAEAENNREAYNVFLIGEKEYDGEKNLVDPEELSVMLMELSPSLNDPLTFEEAAKKLNLPNPLVWEARKLDEGMDSFCLGFFE